MAPLDNAIDLSSGACAARAFTHGAHLVEWTPDGHEPVLWLSPLARFESGIAIRGGVPIVFPWFGSGVSGTMAPSHGFGRLTSWRLDSMERDGDGVTAAFALDSSMVSTPAFPHAFEARYVVRAGERLRLELSVANTGAEAFTFEAVLHTYLAVGDVTAVVVEGLDGDEFVDKLLVDDAPAPPLPRQSGPIRFEGDVDRVYRSSATVRIIDPVRRRVLVVERTGCRSTVVWNPGAATGAAAGDIGADNWRDFVCVEGGNVQQDAITLAAGAAATMTYALHVVPLD